MKTLGFLIILSLMNFSGLEKTADSVYEFAPVTIDGKKTSLSAFEGKVLLIVNTASECGFTPQYEGLQALHDKYSDQDFSVLGFPANNFGGQEPGTDAQIKQFCKVNYGVTFPMFSKVSVKGDDQHPLFGYLTNAPNEDFTGDIKWNFEKFLIDKNGKLIRRFRSDVKPQKNQIIRAIESSLNS